MAGGLPRIATTAAALLACAATIPACTSAPPQPLPVIVTVGQAPHQVAPGTTFGMLVHRLGLRAQPGRLLSVSGEVLRPNASPGAILLNGQPAASDARLSSGDRIVVANGKDRTEPTERVATTLKGLHLGDPELTLRRFHIRRITVTGILSGEVLSTRDVPVGKGFAPRKVALSFDDGPWPVQTKQVLSILHRMHAPATFFMVGYLVERYPEIVRAVREAGMQIGDHSWDHPINPPLADLSEAGITDEIGKARLALRAAGVKPALFRPPGGSYNEYVVEEARRLGMRVVTWSVDPQDWRPGTTSKKIVRSVLNHVRPGSIVLMHDGGGNRGATVNALPRIIRGIRKMRLKLVTIPRAGSAP